MASLYGFSCTEPSNCDYGQTVYESGPAFSDDGSITTVDAEIPRDASTDADAAIIEDSGDAGEDAD